MKDLRSYPSIEHQGDSTVDDPEGIKNFIRSDMQSLSDECQLQGSVRI